MSTFDWSERETLSCTEVTADYSIVQFSPCSKFLAAASVVGDFVIFSLINNEVQATSKHSKNIPICGLAWNPAGNILQCTASEVGTIMIITFCAPLSF